MDEIVEEIIPNSSFHYVNLTLQLKPFSEVFLDLRLNYFCFSEIENRIINNLEKSTMS